VYVTPAGDTSNVAPENPAGVGIAAATPICVTLPGAQDTPLATTFTLFELANPVPITCTTHGKVIGHSMF
jgi:hypothetical protein